MNDLFLTPLGRAEKSDIIRANLTQNYTALSQTLEKRLAFLCDCADSLRASLCAETGGSLFAHCTEDAVREFYLSGKEKMLADSAQAEACNRSAVDVLDGVAALSDAAYLCRRIMEKTGEAPDIADALCLLFGHTRKEAPANRKTAFVRHVQTGRAFEIFAPYIGGAVAACFDSYTAVCEAVANGDCSFGILPLRSSADGRLGAFYNMIEKYELAVLLAASVEGQNGDTVCYALVGAEQSPQNAAGTVRYECRVTLDSCTELARLLNAADLLGARALYADAVPSGRTDEGGTFALCFSFAAVSDIPAFLFFLAMEVPQTIPVAFYTQTEREAHE